MATRNICTYPLETALGKEANAIIEQNGKLKRVNLDWEFDKKANAIVSEADGEVIAVKDSATARAKNIRLFGKSTQKSTTGKNLFKVTAPATYNGVTLSKKDDYYVLNGTATASALFITKIGSLEAGTYALSANNPKHNSLGQISVPIVQVYSSTTLESIAAIDDAVNKTSIVTIKGGENYETRIRIQEGITYDNFIIKPQFERNSVVTEYEPYTGGSPSPRPDWPQEIMNVENPEIDVCGKNLLNSDIGYFFTYGSYKCYKVQHTEQNVTLKLWDKDTSVDVSGCYAGLVKDLDKPNEAYSWALNTGTVIANQITRPYNYMIVYPPTEEALKKIFNRFDIQVEIGDSATEYEDFKENQVLSLPHTLHGIPVASGGNYTDADGQQWICDEIDLERGVYVQRIGKKVLDASSDEYWYTINATGGVIFAHAISDAVAEGSSKRTYCSHFKASVSDAYNKTENACYFYDKTFRVCHMDIGELNAFKAWLSENPITVYYILQTPVETPLTDAEIYAFKHTEMNYPNTTILNDAGAFMKLDYFADTLKFLVKNGGGLWTLAKFEIELPVSGWKISNDNTHYYQEITVPNSTHDTTVELKPTVGQLVSLMNNGTAMFAGNDNGVIKVCAVGTKPIEDMTMQAVRMEVAFV